MLRHRGMELLSHFTRAKRVRVRKGHLYTFRIMKLSMFISLKCYGGLVVTMVSQAEGRGFQSGVTQTVSLYVVCFSYVFDARVKEMV